MKLLIVGSRSFVNYEQMKDQIYSLYSVDEIEMIISGGAKGADSLAQKFAEQHEISFKEFPADWSAYGKRAGILRNIEMVNVADRVIAFWDGKSSGTRFTISYTKEQNKPITVFEY